MKKSSERLEVHQNSGTSSKEINKSEPCSIEHSHIERNSDSGIDGFNHEKE